MGSLHRAHRPMKRSHRHHHGRLPHRHHHGSLPHRHHHGSRHHHDRRKHHAGLPSRLPNRPPGRLPDRTLRLHNRRRPFRQGMRSRARRGTAGRNYGAFSLARNNHSGSTGGNIAATTPGEGSCASPCRSTIGIGVVILERVEGFAAASQRLEPLVRPEGARQVVLGRAPVAGVLAGQSGARLLDEEGAAGADDLDDLPVHEGEAQSRQCSAVVLKHSHPLQKVPEVGKSGRILLSKQRV
mmetsp:Transcript_117601/g.374684  ORF Transcript_117601/g.374684 Transcript_117601/m.374684 type:complete len:240 (+) Transcript_117601:587-1306(+)